MSRRYRVRLRQWRREDARRRHRGWNPLTPGHRKTIETYWNKKGRAK